MKRFNKVLALVLAMTMIFSVLSICASAADTTNAGFKIRFADNEGNAITSVTAGQTANVIISIKTDGYTPVFAFLAFYDYTALTHIRQGGSAVQNLSGNNCRQLYGRFNNTGNYEEADDDLLALEDEIAGNAYVHDWGYTGNITVTPHNDLMWEGIGFTDAQKAKYKGINFGYLVYPTDSNLAPNTEGEYYDMVRFRFLAIADTELNEDTFFLLDNNTKTYINIDPDDMPLVNGMSSDSVKVSNLTVEYEGGVTPPPADPVSVENITTQVQWQDKDAGKMRVAFRGNIKNYTLNLVDGSETEIADISKMGVVYSKSNQDPTIGGANCTDVDAWTIYNFTTGGYFFRAVVGNYGYDDTTTLYAKAYIVIDGQTIYAPSAMTTTGAQAYTAGVANGMSAK